MARKISGILMAGLVLGAVAVLYELLPDYRFWIIAGMIVGLSRR